MAKFIQLYGELFSGITYWGVGEAYEAGPGYVHVDDDMRDYADYIAPGAETSLHGVFVRPSGEHAILWMPLPDNITFVSSGPVLGSVTRYRKGDGFAWDAALQLTLGFFFDNTGSVFPLDDRDLRAALAHKIHVGSYSSLEEAENAVKDHAGPYDSTKRRAPYFR